MALYTFKLFSAEHIASIVSVIAFYILFLGYHEKFGIKGGSKIFLVVFSLLGWLNFRTYEMSHTYHHRYTLFPEGDKEEVHPKIPS